MINELLTAEVRVAEAARRGHHEKCDADQECIHRETRNGRERRLTNRLNLAYSFSLTVFGTVSDATGTLSGIVSLAHTDCGRAFSESEDPLRTSGFKNTLLKALPPSPIPLRHCRRLDLRLLTSSFPTW